MLFGVSPTTNLLTSAFVAGPVTGQSALDKMLDTVSFVPVTGTQSSFEIRPQSITGLNTTTVLSIIPEAPAGGVNSVTSSPLSIDPVLNSTAITQVNKLAGIQMEFDAISTLFATSKPSESDPNLLGLFSPNFVHWGQTLDEFVYRMTMMDGASVGMEVRVVAASAPLTLPAPLAQIPNDATHQWFTFSSTDPVSSGEVIGPWLAVFDPAQGKWLFAGNQMPASIELGTPTVAPADWGSHPCCLAFKAAVPFITHGFSLNFSGVQVTNAAWEFSTPVPFCPPPSVPNGMDGCSSSWTSQYQTPPYINPAVVYAGAGGYYATRDDASTPTAGNLGFALSYHLYEMTGLNNYVLVGPAHITVTATLAVTVTNPASGATKIVRSKPINVSY